MTHVLESFRRVIAENLRFALTALRAHKLRAFLTMVGIVIGVWTVIGMVALVTGFDRSQTEAFTSFGTTLVQFQKFEPRFGPGRRSEEEKKRKDLEIEDADAIEAWLSARAGRRVRIAVPSRGDKRALVELATRNAELSYRTRFNEATAAHFDALEPVIDEGGVLRTSPREHGLEAFYGAVLRRVK